MHTPKWRWKDMVFGNKKSFSAYYKVVSDLTVVYNFTFTPIWTTKLCLPFQSESVLQKTWVKVVLKFEGLSGNGWSKNLKKSFAIFFESQDFSKFHGTKQKCKEWKTAANTEKRVKRWQLCYFAAQENKLTKKAKE